MGGGGEAQIEGKETKRSSHTTNGKAKTFYAFILEVGASVFAVFIFLTLIFFITALPDFSLALVGSW